MRARFTVEAPRGLGYAVVDLEKGRRLAVFFRRTEARRYAKHLNSLAAAAVSTEPAP